MKKKLVLSWITISLISASSLFAQGISLDSLKQAGSNAWKQWIQPAISSVTDNDISDFRAKLQGDSVDGFKNASRETQALAVVVYRGINSKVTSSSDSSYSSSNGLSKNDTYSSTGSDYYSGNGNSTNGHSSLNDHSNLNGRTNGNGPSTNGSMPKDGNNYSSSYSATNGQDDLYTLAYKIARNAEVGFYADAANQKIHSYFDSK